MTIVLEDMMRLVTVAALPVMVFLIAVFVIYYWLQEMELE